jgi:hypothetical protein
MLEPLVYSRFRLIEPDAEALEHAPVDPFPFIPTSQFRITVLASEPAMQIVHEDWFKDNDIEWTYWVDAFHIVLGGSAEITYWNPPDWTDTGTVVANAGSMFLCPRGSRVKWRVTSSEPFRRVVLDIPNPGYSLPEA